MSASAAARLVSTRMSLAGGVDCVGHRRLRRRAQLDLAAGFDGDASAARQIADAAQHWREIDGSHATAAVATVIREPFQLEPDPRTVGGRMNGPITDEVQSVARGQAPRWRRHDGLSMPEVCRHPGEVADRCQPQVVAAAHSRGARHYGLLDSGRPGAGGTPDVRCRCPAKLPPCYENRPLFGCSRDERGDHLSELRAAVLLEKVATALDRRVGLALCAGDQLLQKPGQRRR